MRAATHAARRYLERERGMRDALGHALGCGDFWAHHKASYYIANSGCCSLLLCAWGSHH